VTRYRLSPRAGADLAQILATSADMWGTEAARRYASLFSAAMRKVADDPEGPTTRTRRELDETVRSFAIRLARNDNPDDKVRSPVHILYYRRIAPDLIEFVRVLHERMDPRLHVGGVEDSAD
jgi:toxin ParE1/3/4